MLGLKNRTATGMKPLADHNRENYKNTRHYLKLSKIMVSSKNEILRWFFKEFYVFLSKKKSPEDYLCIINKQNEGTIMLEVQLLTKDL